MPIGVKLVRQLTYTEYRSPEIGVSRGLEMHEFEAQATRMTLAEGLAEYYATNPDLKRGEALPPATRDFFRCHDAVHVVFGCGTAFADEAVVKLSSFLWNNGRPVRAARIRALRFL